jgi:hypothetical protein
MSTQLVLPFEPVLAHRTTLLALRLWPSMDMIAQQQLAQRKRQFGDELAR